MNNRKKNKKRKKQKEYNSWLAVFVFSLIDTFVSISHAGNLIPLFDVSEKLGTKGKKRQDTLHLLLGIFMLAGFFILCISLIKKGHTDMWIFAILTGGILLAIMFYLVCKKRGKK